MSPQGWGCHGRGILAGPAGSRVAADRTRICHNRRKRPPIRRREPPMAVEHAAKMSSAEIVALNRAHTFFSWSVQGALDPIAIDHAEGVYLYTPEGRRILDFNSQLMSVNIGHGDRRVIDAINEQALEAAVRPAGVRHRDPRPAGPEAGRDPARAISTRSSSRSVGPRRSRTPSSSPATTPAARRSWPATARITGRRSGR